MAGATTDLNVHYLETSMTTTVTMASDELVNPDLVLNQGVLNARRRLQLLPREAKFDGFVVTNIAEPTMAKDYIGDFYISLTEDDMHKGFHGQLRAAERANVALSEEMRGLKEEVGSLRKECDALRADNQALTEEMGALKEEVGSLRKLFDGQQKTISQIRLRIVLEQAREKLTVELGRSPADGNSWSDFIVTISQAEMDLVGVTQSMLNLMALGKKSLNRAAHEASIEAIAEAVTSVRTHGDTWRKLFQFAYGQDAVELVFDFESVDA